MDGAASSWPDAPVADSSLTPAGSPHDQAAAEAHHLVPDILQSGLLPGADGPADGVPPVVACDARPEETADLIPLSATRDQAAEWQHQPGIGAPPKAPERRRRNVELQACDRSAGPDHPG